MANSGKREVTIAEIEGFLGKLEKAHDDLTTLVGLVRDAGFEGVRAMNKPGMRDALVVVESFVKSVSTNLDKAIIDREKEQHRQQTANP